MAMKQYYWFNRLGSGKMFAVAYAESLEAAWQWFWATHPNVDGNQYYVTVTDEVN